MSKSTKIANILIDADLDLYVDITGDDIYGTGTSANPWASPHKALESLNGKRIEYPAAVTIHMSAGTFTFSEPVRCYHPNGSQINFVGAGFTGNRLHGIPIGDYSVNRNSPVVPARGADEFYNTSGTLAANANEATRDAARLSDQGDNDTLIRARFDTIVEFTDGNGGFEALDGDIGLIDGMAIIGEYVSGDDIDTAEDMNYHPIIDDSGQSPIGDYGKSASGIFASNGRTIFVGLDVVVHGFSYGIYSTNGARITCNFNADDEVGICISGCFYGLRCTANAELYSNYSTVCGITTYGISALYSSYIYCDGALVSGSGYGGIISAWTSYILCNESTSSGNYYDGVVATVNSSVRCEQLNTYGNYSGGASSIYGSTIYAPDVWAIGNNGIGVGAQHSSNAVAQTLPGGPASTPLNRQTKINNNGNHGAYSVYGSTLFVGGAQVYSNEESGLLCEHNSTLYAIHNNDLAIAYRTYVWDSNSNHLVFCAWHSYIIMVGAAALRTSNSYASVLTAYNSTTYMSHTTNPSSVGGIAGGAYPFIYSSHCSYLYDGSSNLSVSPATASYYGPLGNTEGNVLSYNVVY